LTGSSVNTSLCSHWRGSWERISGSARPDDAIGLSRIDWDIVVVGDPARDLIAHYRVTCWDRETGTFIGEAIAPPVPGGGPPSITIADVVELIGGYRLASIIVQIESERLRRINRRCTERQRRRARGWLRSVPNSVLTEHGIETGAGRGGPAVRWESVRNPKRYFGDTYTGSMRISRDGNQQVPFESHLERDWLIPTDAFDFRLKSVVAQPRVHAKKRGLPYRFEGKDRLWIPDFLRIRHGAIDARCRSEPSTTGRTRRQAFARSTWSRAEGRVSPVRPSRR
jgi:hypothetical protein